MILDEILEKSVKIKASDVHLVVNHHPIFRIDGELKEDDTWPVLLKEAILDLVKPILSEKQQKQFFEEKELDLSYQIGEKVRFRTNLFWERSNPSLAARVIPSKIPTMKEIYMPKISYDLIKKKQGLIIATGPTGCGKSTTLAAMINEINSTQVRHIITLEDPVEFAFHSEKSVIVQRELGKDMLSFANGLKHIVRQDPDIIMVGEMRDLETIGATITLAETGHLVLATLHTNSAAQTIDRIIDIFPPYQQRQIRFQISLALSAVVAQRLLPKIGGGRVAAREVMINTPAIGNLIREDKIAQVPSAIQTSGKLGMFTLEQDIVRLVQGNVISPEVASFYGVDLSSYIKKR